MKPIRTPNAAAILALLLHVTGAWAQNPARVEPDLGPAPEAPRDVWRLPGAGPRKLGGMKEAGFNVNVNSREEARQFYNAVYPASLGFPINSTADTANCIAGTSSGSFENAVLWRINWFRAMSGIPAAVTFSASESADDQSAALLMSANGTLMHVGIPSSWSCFATNGTNAAAHSNLAIGINGPDAITGYICDFGANNSLVGHRRFVLYPQTQVMASGDVPAQGATSAANATWVVDANYSGPRPGTAAPYVAWPPPGYVPYPVVFPQWSFALSNADLGQASVTMLSNGVPMSVVIQPYVIGYGENTLVWHPSALDPASASAIFPFNGADTVYAITISNAIAPDATQIPPFVYNVTLFDPATPGADFVPTLISGPNPASINWNNPYSCTPSANPNTTGYQWLVAQAVNGNLADHALNGLTNFTISPAPGYSVITNPPAGSGRCFHLTHTNLAPQLLEFTETLFPATNTTLSFQSLLGWATTNEVARVQISTNDDAWVDIWSQPGTGDSGQTAFANHTLSLSNCAGRITHLRFDYDFTSGLAYNETSTNVGWCLENIVISNASQLVNFATNSTVSTNFNIDPTQTGNWILEVRGVIFGQFTLDWSPASLLAAVSTTNVLKAPLVVRTSGPGTILSNYNGQSLAIGLNYSMTATNAAGVKFTGWTGGTNPPFSALTNAAKLTFTMETNLTLIASFVDPTPPGITVISPAAKQRWSNSTFTARGTAKDNVQVSNVFCQLNSNGWTPAIPGSAAWTNWTATLTPLKSTNLFQAYSVDTSGNKSSISNVTLLYIPSAPLTVLTNGSGSITPVDNGKLLAVGTNYTLTAAPGSNWLFSNWVGGTTTPFTVLGTNLSCAFRMQSNLVIEANFVTNPFLAAQGNYYGLFAPADLPRRQTNSGSFTLSVTPAGIASGNLWLGAKKIPFGNVKFNVGGMARFTATPAGGRPLSAVLQLNLAGQSVQGTVTDGSFVALLNGDQGVFNSAHQATNYEGQYTFIIPGAGDRAIGPFGISIGTVTVSSNGIVAFAGGSLADGTTGLSQSSGVSKDGLWPFYVPLYNGTGSLWGMNRFTNHTIISDPFISWINATNSAKGALYRSGFTNEQAALIGSFYNPSNKPFLGLTNLQVTLEAVNPPISITNQVTWASNNAITVPVTAQNTNGLTLTNMAKTGLISGTFLNPANAKQTITVNGVVLQDQTNAAGWFPGTNQSGAFLLRRR